jgi:hypothetical protein
MLTSCWQQCKMRWANCYSGRHGQHYMPYTTCFRRPKQQGQLTQRTQSPRKSWPKGTRAGPRSRKFLAIGWLDGRSCTVQLPPPRADDLLKEVAAVLRKKRVPLKRFRSLSGRLQHAARILPWAQVLDSNTDKPSTILGSVQFDGYAANH